VEDRAWYAGPWAVFIGHSFPSPGGLTMGHTGHSIGDVPPRSSCKCLFLHCGLPVTANGSER
jgi:hypothetical protein